MVRDSAVRPGSASTTIHASKGSESSNGPNGERPYRSGRWFRRAAIGAGVLLVVMVLIVWQLPAILSSRMFRGVITGAISTPEAPVTIDSLSLQWSGDQVIKGLHYADLLTGNTADLDLTLSGSLWSWMRGSRDFGTVKVSGKINLAGQGQSSGPADKKTGPTAPSKYPAEPFTLPGDLQATIEFAQLQITAPVAASGANAASTVEINDLHGTAQLSVSAGVSVHLQGETLFSDASEAPGQVLIDGSITHLFDISTGRFEIRSAQADLRLIAEHIPTVILDHLGAMDGQLTELAGPTIGCSIAVKGKPGDATGLFNITGGDSVVLKTDFAWTGKRFEITRPSSNLVVIPPVLIHRWVPSLKADGIDIESNTPVTVQLSTLAFGLDPTTFNADFAGATIDGSLSIMGNSMRLATPSGPHSLTIMGFNIALRSDDLTGTIAASLSGVVADRTGSGQVKCGLEGSVSIAHLFNADGTISLDAMTADGAVEATAVPVPIIDAFVQSDHWLEEALGQSIDHVRLSAKSRVTAGKSPRGRATDLDLSVQCMNLTGSVAATLDGESVHARANTPTLFTLQPSDALTARLQSVIAGQSLPIDLRKASSASVALRSFSLPLKSSGSILDELAFDGTIQLRGLDSTLKVAAAADPPGGAQQRVQIQTLNLNMSAEKAGQSVRSTISANVIVDAAASFTLAAKAGITFPFDSTARTLSVDMPSVDVPASVLQPWISRQWPLAQAIIGPSISIGAGGEITNQSRQLEVDITGANTSMTAKADFDVKGSTGQVDAHGTLNVTPGLLEALQTTPQTRAAAAQQRPVDAPDSKSAPASNELISVTEPATLGFMFSAKGSTATGSAPTDWPMNAKVSADAITLTHLTTSMQPATLADVKVEATLDRGFDGDANLKTSCEVRNPSHELIGSISATATGALASKSYLTDWMASLTASVADFQKMEALAGLAPGMLSAILGRQGSLTLAPTAGANQTAPNPAGSRTLAIALDCDRVQGVLAGQVDSHDISLHTDAPLNFTIPKAQMSDWLNRLTSNESAVASAQGKSSEAARPVNGNPDPRTPPPQPRPVNTAAKWACDRDTTVKFQLEQLAAPVAMFAGGEAYKPDEVVLNGQLAATSFSAKYGESSISLSNPSLTISGENLLDGLKVRIATADARSGGQSANQTSSGSSILDLDGVVRAGASMLKGGQAPDLHYSLAGRATSIPVGVIDAMTNLDGKLTASLGPIMNLNVDVEDYSHNTGTMTARCSTANGYLEVDGGEFRDGILHFATMPVHASLNVTQAMSQAVLSNINPLFYDVQKKSGPIEFVARSMSLPLDGDLSKLSCNFSLDMGQVYVPTSGILGELLGTLKPEKDAAQTAVDQVKSTIPPITGKITNGMLSYSNLVLQAPSFEISSSGRINLAKRELDLTVSVPLIGWKSVFMDMTHIAPSFLTSIPLNVPFYLKVTGSVDHPKIYPDPAGAQRVAQDFFKNTVQNVLQNVFQNPIEKKKDDNRQ